jgi:hypothetical protein
MREVFPWNTPQSPSWSKASAVATVSPSDRAARTWNALGSTPLSPQMRA